MLFFFFVLNLIFVFGKKVQQPACEPPMWFLLSEGVLQGVLVGDQIRLLKCSFEIKYTWNLRMPTMTASASLSQVS